MEAQHRPMLANIPLRVAYGAQAANITFMSCLSTFRFESIDELEDVQLAHCARFQRQPERIRSTTLFHWWAKQIHKHRGLRRN